MGPGGQERDNSIYEKPYDVFISYRRQGGEYLAKMLYDKLLSLGYRPFLDVETMRSGKFNEQLYHVIERCSDFLLLLTPGALDRCVSPEDWVRKEVLHAMGAHKNVIPICTRDFVWPEQLPPELASLPNYESMQPTTEYFDAWIDKLCSKMLHSKPRKKRSGRKLATLAAGCAVLAAAVALAAVLTGRGRRAEPVPSPAPTLAAEPSASPTPSPSPEPVTEQTLHILLTPSADTSIQDRSADIALLRQRLDILAGPESYTLTEDGADVQLDMPASLFGQSDAESILNCYVIRPVRLYAFSLDSGHYSEDECVAIGRGDIASAVHKTGRIDGLDTARYELPAQGDYDYIELTLTDSFALANADAFRRWGGNMYIGHDLEQFPQQFYYFHTAPAGDGKRFYLFLGEDVDACWELEQFDLGAQALSAGFSCVVGSHSAEQSYHVLFTPSAQLTMSQYARQLELFRQRVEVLAGPGDFRIIDRGGSFELYLDRRLLSEEQLTQVLQRHLARPNDLYIYNGSTAQDRQLFALDRADLAAVELLPEQDGGQVRHIRLTLTDQCAARLAEQTADWDGQLTLAMDVERSSPWYDYPTAVSGDGKSLTIDVAELCPNYARLIAHVLTDEPYQQELPYAVLLDDILWEESSGAHPLQCTPDSLPGPGVTMVFRPEDEDISQWEYKYALEELKARLDAIGLPYAVGSRLDRPWELAVMTGLERMSTAMMHTLCLQAPDVTVQAGLCQWSGAFASLEFTPDEDGVCRSVTVRADDFASGDMDAFVQAAQGQDIVLLLRGEPLLVCDPASYAGDGTLVFDRMYAGGETIAQTESWLPAFLDRLDQGSIPGYSLAAWQFEPGPGGRTPASDDFGLADPALGQAMEQLTSALTAALPSSDVRVRYEQDERGAQQAYVQLDLAVDDDFPARALDAIKAVYDASRLEQTPFASITVCLTDEDALTGERARLCLAKVFDVYPHGDFAAAPAGISLSGQFANGRIAGYIDRLRQLIGSDALLASLTPDIDYRTDGLPVWDGQTDG